MQLTDPYVLENGCLKNKLNITSSDKLRQAEADIGFLKIINVDSVDGDYPDEVLIQNIHKHIFEDIFDWAGEYRKVPLVKEELVLPGYSIPYSDYQNIQSDLRKRILDLNSCTWSNMSAQEISMTFARKIALLWKVHPFRDGNTRTVLSFAFLYAKRHGFPFDIEIFTNELNREYHENGRVSKYSIRDKFVLACLDDKDYPEVEFLASTFQKAMNCQEQEKNKSM